MIILRQVNYSYPYLDQKEYNIISDIWYSGLKRAYKKNAGKIRRKINNKLFKTINENEDKLKDVSPRIIQNENVVNLDKKQATKLYKNAHDNLSASIRPLNTDPSYTNTRKANARKVYARKACAGNVKTKDAQNFYEKALKSNVIELDPKDKKDMLRTEFETLGNKKHQSRRAVNRIMGDKHPTDYSIFWSKKDGYEQLGHEMGHIENSKSKNPIRRWINKTANNPETRRKFEEEVGGSDKGIKDSIKNWAIGKIILQEEKNASKNSIKHLKEIGATPEQLDTAKKNLKDALETYKLRSKTYWMNPLYNATSIKGLKKKQVENRYYGIYL